METPPPNATVVAIDGTALLFRAYYGAPAVTDRYGVPVGAVIGAVRTIVDLVARARGRHYVVVFDAAQRTFRNDLFPAYKANRGAPPDDLVPQFDRVVRAVDALGIKTLRLVGYEADDLMATLARMAREQRLRTWLVSPDKDLFQLVVDAEPAIQIYDRS
jgi:DNA polymerase-1